MKFFLASLASETLDLVLPLLPDKPQNLKLAFIPTAADPYLGQDMPWMTADHDKLISMGFSVTDYDLKNKNIDDLRKDLAAYQVIFVAGGNTFYLLNEVRKSGFDIVIKELMDAGVVYIGASAGSMIMGPDLNHLMTVDHPEIVKELTDYTCLNITKERILPHFGKDKYALRHAQIIAEWGDKVLPLRDDQALVVNGDTITVIIKKETHATQ
jgi:dipeptidase E